MDDNLQQNNPLSPQGTAGEMGQNSTTEGKVSSSDQVTNPSLSGLDNSNLNNQETSTDSPIQSPQNSSMGGNPFNSQPAQMGVGDETVSPPPFKALSPTTPASPQPQGASVSGNVVTTQTKPKGSIVKKLLAVLLILLVVAGVGFAAWKFWPKGFLGIGKPGEIVWWGLWEDETIVRSLIDEYQASHNDVKITYVKQSPQDYRERLMNSLAKGEGPDIFRFHNSWVPMLQNDLDKMPATVMTPQAFSETFYPVMSSDLTSGTAIVGIPLGYDAITLYVNEDIFAKYGKSVPTTWDDFRQTASDLTIKDDKGNVSQYGAAIGNTENMDHWQEVVALMLVQNGVSLTKPDKQPGLASDALAFYRQFYNVDKVWSDKLPPSTISFAGGNLAMYFGPTWRAFEIRQQNPSLNFRTVPVPQLPKQSPTEPDVSYATYWVEGVWNRSNSKEVAWDFLKYLSTKESLEKLYKNASTTRLFGEPYPRVDMADSLIGDSVVGSVIKLAPVAKSWYLNSRTFDGDTGINSKINAYYLDLVNKSGNKGVDAKSLKTVTDGVTQVFSQYGISQ
jgi:ABC-type glycerol-3-phosphate transport system substrate-binding protein